MNVPCQKLESFDLRPLAANLGSWVVPKFGVVKTYTCRKVVVIEYSQFSCTSIDVLSHLDQINLL